MFFIALIEDIRNENFELIVRYHASRRHSDLKLAAKCSLLQR